MNRHERRRQDAARVEELKCNLCGKIILRVRARALRARGDDKMVVARALDKHQRATGCRPKPVTIADHLPEGPRFAEMICAGCGLIVCTVPMTEARSDPEATQSTASAHLRAHVTATGCTGRHPAQGPRPSRRDGRCADGLHAEACRCEDRPADAAERVEQGVFVDMSGPS